MPSYAGGPPAADEKPPSKEMSGAAMGAAILAVCCFPLWFVAIGLAITVLVRSAGGRDHGRVLAIVTLAVCAVELVVVGVWAVVSGLEGLDLSDDDGDRSSAVADDGMVRTQALEVGDCFDDGTLGDKDATLAPAEVEVMPCGKAHDAEVVHIIQVEGTEFPGDRAINRRSRECLPAFEKYVGIPFADSRLWGTSYQPSRSSWMLGDRSIICIAHERRLDPMRGSVEGARY